LGADPELVELVEMDIRELLAKNGYDEDRRAKVEFLDLKVVLEHPTRVAALASGEAACEQDEQGVAVLLRIDRVREGATEIQRRTGAVV